MKYNKNGRNCYAKKEKPLGQLPTSSEGYGDFKIYLAEMQRTQLRNYKDNKMQRLNIDILKRLCYVLECNLHDLIEYIPPKEP